MIDTIWVILAIVLLTVIFIVIVVIIDPNIKISGKYKKNRSNKKENKNHSTKEVITEIDKPGKILVSDSTYEILMEDKKKQS